MIRCFIWSSYAYFRVFIFIGYLYFWMVCMRVCLYIVLFSFRAIDFTKSDRMNYQEINIGSYVEKIIILHQSKASYTWPLSYYFWICMFYKYFFRTNACVGILCFAILVESHRISYHVPCSPLIKNAYIVWVLSQLLGRRGIWVFKEQNHLWKLTCAHSGVVWWK
jgi:hypothetical protein